MAALKWIRGDAYHQVSECKRWTINKTGGPPVYMLVRNGKPDQIVKVGTLQECRQAATTRHG